MPTLPAALLKQLTAAPGFDEPAFVAVHAAAQPPVSVRLHPKKITPEETEHLPIAAPVLWAEQGRYLSERPVFSLDPLWHAGAYYVQEASSMAIELAWQHVPQQQPVKVLDLCAAPGGKSTHLLSLMKPEDVLVTNEVISSRVNILLENITRWGNANVLVTNNDPKDFGQLDGLFDVLLIDAPCSGSGLFRRDPEAIQEWSEDNVTMCWQRQQRIIADAWNALAPGGIFIYTTCSFSPEEDEAVVDWVHQQFDVESLAVTIPESSGIVTSMSETMNHPCYRFYPNLVKGEGFFMAVFRKKSAAEAITISSAKQKAYRTIKAAQPPVDVARWVKEEADLQWYMHKEVWYAMPANTFDTFAQLQNSLKVRKAGVCVGEMMHQQLQPDHALAMSNCINSNIRCIELSLSEALKFLRKEAIEVEAEKGWHLVCFQQVPLGWIKHLGNRSNNYYPKEWRLRM